MKSIVCILMIASASAEINRSSINKRMQPLMKKITTNGKLIIPNIRVPQTNLSIPKSGVVDITLKDIRNRISLKNPLSLIARGGSTTTKRRRRNNTGFYYGIKEDVFFLPYEKTRSDSSKGKDQARIDLPTSTALADIMGETLLELREMREDLSALREEMQHMQEEFKRKRGVDPNITDDGPGTRQEEGESHSSGRISSFVARRKRQREFEEIGTEVEKWANELLFEQYGEQNGWKEIKCNKAMKKNFNRNDATSVYIKWMKDSRGDKALDNDQLYPCLKVYSTVDAPFEHVCQYLSDEKHFLEYNDLLVSHRELEEISPTSKICWAQSPQILFIKSRDFVSYCQYRFRKDGTQIVVNQACDHSGAIGTENESEGKVCRGITFRGANFISSDPDDPNKTKFALLAHVDPGGGIQSWALKTACSALLPIEPFKLFYKIDNRVNALCDSIREKIDSLPSHCTRPAGLSQMGYACFWPAREKEITREERKSTTENGNIETEVTGKESANERCLTQ